MNGMTLENRPLRRGDYFVVAVSSMEQIIGTTLSAVVGIMMPLITLLGHPHLSSVAQGIMGAAGLIGISVGSAIIGTLMDRQGYLLWFRLCPVMIIAGSMIVYFSTALWLIIAGLVLTGIGVGGGYSLDSAYISEIVPEKWKQFMVGVAKSTCSLGFVLAALISLIMIRLYPYPRIWNSLILIITGLGVITLMLRIRWYNPPVWLLARGKTKEAQKAVDFFIGKGIDVTAKSDDTSTKENKFAAVQAKGLTLNKIIFSGVPWACEGLGVYGFGVFLPILLMALGITSGSAEGMPKVINSVEMTLWVNLAMVPGFMIGLLLVRKHNRAWMMTNGFLGCAVGLGLLFAAFSFHLPIWISMLGLVIFEIALNAGPHLVTFIIPSQIYAVSDRGEGSGIAAMIGKVGAIVGVFLMPVLLERGGMPLILTVSIAVMAAGALITWIYGKLLKVM